MLASGLESSDAAWAKSSYSHIYLPYLSLYIYLYVEHFRKFKPLAALDISEICKFQHIRKVVSPGLRPAPRRAGRASTCTIISTYTHIHIYIYIYIHIYIYILSLHAEAQAIPYGHENSIIYIVSLYM